MRLTNQEKHDLKQQMDNLNSLSRMDRTDRDEYFGWTDYSSSRRQRESGFTEDGVYWEE